MTMPSFNLILVTTLATLLHMSVPSSSNPTTASPGTNVWHSVHNGKIWVSDEGLKLSRTKAIAHCRSLSDRFSGPLSRGAYLLEMPVNDMFNNVEKILNRIGVGEGEKLWVSGTLLDDGYMWMRNGSSINRTLYNEDRDVCYGDSVYAFLSSSGKMRLCSNFSSYDLRFICYKSAPGARLVEVDATTKIPSTKEAFILTNWTEYGTAYGNFWVSASDEKATFKDAGKFCCKLANSNYDYWTHHELLEVVTTIAYNIVSETMKKEIAALEQPSVYNEKMFWLGSTMHDDEVDYRWMVSNSFIEKKWFSKKKNCEMKAHDGGSVAGIIENGKLRFCQVHSGQKLRFMCMRKDIGHSMEGKLVGQFEDCLR